MRDGIEFHNGKTVTAEDVAATIERHADENSKSGALGILKNIKGVKASGKEVIVTLADAGCRLPLSDGRLPSRHPAEWRQGRSECRHQRRPLQGHRSTSRACAMAASASPITGSATSSAMPTRSRSSSSTTPPPVCRPCRAARCNMINRVEPKVVDLVKRVPGVSIESDVGPRLLSVQHVLRHRALRQQRPAHGAEARHGPRGTARQDPAGLRHDRQRLPDQRGLSAVPGRHRAAQVRPGKGGRALQEVRPSGSILLRTSDVAFPGAVDAAQLYQQSCAKAGIKIEIKREPGDGYWSEVWNKQPFSLSYWGGRATQSQMYSTALASTADWNDTRFKRPEFDKMLRAARRRTRPGQAQGDLPRHGHDGARRRRH